MVTDPISTQGPSNPGDFGDVPNVCPEDSEISTIGSYTSIDFLSSSGLSDEENEEFEAADEMVNNWKVRWM